MRTEQKQKVISEFLETNTFAKQGKGGENSKLGDDGYGELFHILAKGNSERRTMMVEKTETRTAAVKEKLGKLLKGKAPAPVVKEEPQQEADASAEESCFGKLFAGTSKECAACSQSAECQTAMAPKKAVTKRTPQVVQEEPVAEPEPEPEAKAEAEPTAMAAKPAPKKVVGKPAAKAPVQKAVTPVAKPAAKPVAKKPAAPKKSSRNDLDYSVMKAVLKQGGTIEELAVRAHKLDANNWERRAEIVLFSMKLGFGLDKGTSLSVSEKDGKVKYRLVEAKA
jgi:hypothetical protein